jgi:hypothetical protein
VNTSPKLLRSLNEPSPAAPIGYGLPVLLAAGAMLFGAKLLERSKKQRALSTAVPRAIA